MAGAVRACPSCGTRNRVPVSAAGTPACGSCHAKLPWLVDVAGADFDAAVHAKVPVLVDLWAPWCGPCRMVAPVLEQLAVERAGRLKVVKVNVDEEPGISARFGVQGIPTMLLFRDGELAGSQVGAQPAHAIEAWLDR